MYIGVTSCVDNFFTSKGGMAISSVFKFPKPAWVLIIFFFSRSVLLFNSSSNTCLSYM
uniref:Uncharacterized protein n=1 Tax=uncultured marine virus TaxID=186617 RepID=A0A0F7L9U1_9VIRU|nr:hypothetical protein [uncultured marine virus]